VKQSAQKLINGPISFENWQIICQLASYFSKEFNFNNLVDIQNEIETSNRLTKYFSDDSAWTNSYFSNGYSEKAIKLADSFVDLSTFDPVKSLIHFQENYYFNSIKKLLL